MGKGKRVPVEEPPLRELYDYWSGKRCGRVMPTREDIDPVDIPRLLPNLMLLEVHAAQPAAETGPYRFRFRLAGTAICQIAGVDLTGRWLDEMFYPGRYTEYLIGLNSEVVERRRASYTRTELLMGGGHYTRTTTRVICPLGRDDAAVSMILAGQMFDSLPQWTPLAETEEEYEFVEVAHELLP
jgi:hypothetical protein